MKVNFHQQERQQKAVMEEQTMMRAKRFRRRPYWIMFLVFILVIGLGYVVYQWYTNWTMRASGIVVADEVTHSTPNEARVLELMAQRGSTVEKGDLLCILQPISKPGEIEGLEAQLEGLEKQRMLLEESSGLVGGAELTLETQIESNQRYVNDLKSRISRFDAEIKRRQNARAMTYEGELNQIDGRIETLTDRIKDKELDLERTKLETQKLVLVRDRRKERYDQVTELFELQAATKEQLETTKNEYELSALSVKQGRESEIYLVDLIKRDQSEIEARQAERTKRDNANQVRETEIITSEAEERKSLVKQLESGEKMLVVLEAQRKRVKRSTEAERTLALKKLESEISVINTKLELLGRHGEHIEIRSDVDGVVTSLPSSVGVVLRTGEPVFSIAKTDSIRVECYLDTKWSKNIETNQRVRIYSELLGKPVQGVITGPGKFSTRIPPILRSNDMREETKLLVVIKPDHHDRLVPGEVVRVVIPD